MCHTARLPQLLALLAALLASPVRANDVQTQPITPNAPAATEIDTASAPLTPAEPPDPSPAVILPDTLKWTPLPDSPESRQVWLHGNETAHGPKLLRTYP